MQGGTVDVDGDFANVAILRFMDGTSFWGCSGTLVEPDVIITAANCTEGATHVYNSFETQGPAGNLPGPGWTEGGSDIHTDPDWMQNNSLDDIGVIVRPAGVEGITPASIAPEGYLDDLDRRTLFTLVGYGVTTAKPSSAPQKPVQTYDRIRRWTTAPLSNVTSDTIILAMSTKDKRGGGGTCSGDSGGAVFLDGYLVGVVSWGTSQF